MPNIKPLRDFGAESSERVGANHIILLVDASGSMWSHVNETRESICSIIKELDKDTHLNLIFFNTREYQIVTDDWCRNIAPELAYTYNAHGGTPITDSVYKAIQDITSSLGDIEKLSDKHKIIIFTDGEENSSEYVKSEDLGRAIEHFTDNFGWDFQFIGPKSQEGGIKNYTNLIKIKAENVTLYAEMSDGLKSMKEKVIS